MVIYKEKQYFFFAKILVWGRARHMDAAKASTVMYLRKSEDNLWRSVFSFYHVCEGTGLPSSGFVVDAVLSKPPHQAMICFFLIYTKYFIVSIDAR